MTAGRFQRSPTLDPVSRTYLWGVLHRGDGQYRPAREAFLLLEGLPVVQKIVETLNSDILFTEEVSSLTRVPVATLRWLKATGKGPKCGKLGKRVIYLRSDVEAWVASAFDGTA